MTLPSRETREGAGLHKSPAASREVSRTLPLQIARRSPEPPTKEGRRAWTGSPNRRREIALATLTVLEIVLGIDNIIFISILSEKVRADQRARARRLGLAIAMLTRIALLFSIVWVMRLTAPRSRCWDTRSADGTSS